jgi:predicted transporter
MLLIGAAVIAVVAFLFGLRVGIALGYRGERRRRALADAKVARLPARS